MLRRRSRARTACRPCELSSNLSFRCEGWYSLVRTYAELGAWKAYVRLFEREHEGGSSARCGQKVRIVYPQPCSAMLYLSPLPSSLGLSLTPPLPLSFSSTSLHTLAASNAPSRNTPPDPPPAHSQAKAKPSAPPPPPPPLPPQRQTALRLRTRLRIWTRR